MPIYKNSDPKRPATFIQCDCHHHALHIDRYEDDEWDKGFEISIWDRSPAKMPFPFLERLRWCWWILRKGRPWADYLIIDDAKAKEISNFILENTQNKEKI
jgi:hypothetical protein